MRPTIVSRLVGPVLVLAVSALSAASTAQSLYTVSPITPADFKSIREALESPRVGHRDIFTCTPASPITTWR
jgi:hypothetical protein